MTPTAMTERFWSHVAVGEPEECWPWLRTKNAWGYGNFVMAKNKFITASRFALMQKLGRPIRPGMQACHMCDNPPCCNPAHLFEGTRSDNMRDCVSKGRHQSQVAPQSHVRGEGHPIAVLTEQSVRSIRDLSRNGMTQRAIAKRFGISKSQVANIVNGRQWAWLV